MKNYSMKLKKRIEKVLHKLNWDRFLFDEREGVFLFGTSSEGSVSSLFYQIVLHPRSFTVYACSSLKLDEDDEDMIVEMSKYLHYVNHGVRNGNFDLEIETGKIRYKCFSDGTNQKQHTLAKSITLPALMFEKTGDGICDIVYSGATAEEAYQTFKNGLLI